MHSPQPLHEDPILRHTTATTGDDASDRGPVELLWHQRLVELTGTLHRVRVPLIGDATTPSGSELSLLLASWWVGRPGLSPTVEVTSVVADVVEAAEGFELMLLVTTAGLAEDHSIVNVRMIRDLRRALRIQRLGAPARSPRLAA